jgi:anaerobic selenocysteine-containing dehydrogenase
MKSTMSDPIRHSATRRSTCRICIAHCPVLVDIEDGRPVGVRGDKSNPVYEGYLCSKGQRFALTHTEPERLRTSMKRAADGTFQPVSAEGAIAEVAAKLRAILERDGPRAIAIYCGTSFYQTPSAVALANAWLDAIGTPMRFSSGTIDQPGKQIAGALHGSWMAGTHVFDESDTWMLVGTNPLIAMSGGIPHANPARRLKRHQDRGLCLIVIDPRKTETARRARLHLQPHPGQDPPLLAGILREVIRRSLHDREFIAAHVQGFETLRAAVEPFTPEVVAARTGVPGSQVVEAAVLFGSARRGSATAGTGPNMAGRGNLTEYLLLCLNTICGRWLRAGERVASPGILTTRRDFVAQATPPAPAWGFGEQLRVRGFTGAACGLATSALADEILLQGKGQVKALITCGGNPMLAWPDQQRTFAAMKALELSVVLDPRMTATGRLADYVIAPKLPLELPGTTLAVETLRAVSPAYGYSVPYAQYVEAAVDPPPGSDLIEDWEFFYGLAREMSLPLNITPGIWATPGVATPQIALDMERRPTSEEMLGFVTRGSFVSLEELKRQKDGLILESEEITVLPADPDCTARLQVGDPTMLAELGEVAATAPRAPTGFSHLMISRRMLHIFNSVWPDHAGMRDRQGLNPAFLNPDDMREMNIGKGQLVEIRSAHGSIEAVAWPDPGLRPGVVSIAHGCGDNPDVPEEPRIRGTNVGRLISVEVDYDPYSGIPRMSALPVNVVPREPVVAGDAVRPG